VEDASLHGGTKGEEKKVYYGRFQAKLNNMGQPKFQSISTLDESTKSDSGFNASSVLLKNPNADSGVIHMNFGSTENDIFAADLFHYKANDLTFETQSCFARDETRGNLYHKNDTFIHRNSRLLRPAYGHQYKLFIRI
jgi:hypothetical protein